MDVVVVGSRNRVVVWADLGQVLKWVKRWLRPCFQAPVLLLAVPANLGRLRAKQSGWGNDSALDHR